MKLSVSILLIFSSVENYAGPARSLEVFPGDVITGEVKAYFTSTPSRNLRHRPSRDLRHRHSEGIFSRVLAATNSNKAAIPLAEVLACPACPPQSRLLSGLRREPSRREASGPGGSAAIDGGITTACNTTGNPLIALGGFGESTFPSGYLNYILFDENYVPIKAKSFPVQNLPSTRHTVQFDVPLEIKELGYLFVYLSYDNNQSSLYLYFDDLKITVDESPLIQVNNYYPFGMISGTWLREGEQNNANLFQGKELIAQTGWHDFGSRMYWADLGRWFSSDPQKQFSSPYVGMGNMPAMGRDPDGEIFQLIPFLLTLSKIYGYASTAISLAQGYSQGGWDGLGKAFASSAFTFGAGLLVGPLVGSISPDGVFGIVPGALAGGATGGLVGGLSAVAGGGDFWEGAKSGAIGGAITGALAGYQAAASSKYERNTIFGHKTEAGNKAMLKDLGKNFVRSGHIASDMNPEAIYVSRQTEASGETNLGPERYKGGRLIRGDSKATAETVPSTVTEFESGSPTSSESRIYLTRSALRTYRKAYDIFGHEIVHARLNKNGLSWQWMREFGVRTADRLTEILAYRWQFQHGMRVRASAAQYANWSLSKYGN